MSTDPLVSYPAEHFNAARIFPLDESVLKRVVSTGLLRCAVSPAMGGTGGSLNDLAEGLRLMRASDVTAARVLYAQRLAIEALVQSPNVGLRELWLPDMLSGARAGTVALNSLPLSGHDTGRGWLLKGLLKNITNLAWEGFSLVAPVRLGDGPPAWVLLRSEEDGLTVEASAVPPEEGAVDGYFTLNMQSVFFREDEWLGGPGLQTNLTAVANALMGTQPHASI